MQKNQLILLGILSILIMYIGNAFAENNYDFKTIESQFPIIQTETQSQSLYQNSEYGFSIKYPSNWQKVEQLSQDKTFPKMVDLVTFQSPTKLTQYGIMIIKNDSTYQGLSGGEFLDKMQNDFGETICNSAKASGSTCTMKVIAESPIIHQNGYSGYMSGMEFTITSDKGTIQPAIFLGMYPDGNNIWVLTLLGFSQEEYNQVTDDLSAMGGSFQIFNYKGVVTENPRLSPGCNNTPEIITLPDYKETKTIPITGTLPGYKRGTPIEIIIEMPDGTSDSMGIIAKKTGEYGTSIIIDSSWKTGLYNIRVNYDSETINCFTINLVSNVSPTKSNEIPAWVKNNAKWWAQGILTDDEFIKGIEFLINQGVIRVPTVESDTTSSSEHIPAWLKNTIKWWADGTIPDSDVINGIQYLVKNNIINVKVTKQNPQVKQTPVPEQTPPTSTPEQTPTPTPTPAKGLTGTYQGIAKWTATFEYYSPVKGLYTETCRYTGNVMIGLTQTGNDVGGTAQVSDQQVSADYDVSVCQQGFSVGGVVAGTIFGSGFSGTVGVLDVDAQFTSDLLRGQVSGNLGGVVAISGEFTASRTN